MKTYAFIDSQNLNLGTSKDIYRNGKLVYTGWKLDFKKFRKYLSDKFRVDKAFLFIGYIQQNEKLYAVLSSYGYDLIFKPTVKDSQGKPKGNVDAELVLHAGAIEFPNFDKAVIVSGDGDFHCLHQYLVKHKRLLGIVIPNRKSESSLLRDFQKYKVFLVRDRDKVEEKNNLGGVAHYHEDKRSFLPSDYQRCYHYSGRNQEGFFENQNDWHSRSVVPRSTRSKP